MNEETDNCNANGCECRKFIPNQFKKNLCSNCYLTKSSHSNIALANIVRKVLAFEQFQLNFICKNSENCDDYVNNYHLEGIYNVLFWDSHDIDIYQDNLLLCHFDLPLQNLSVCFPSINQWSIPKYQNGHSLIFTKLNQFGYSSFIKVIKDSLRHCNYKDLTMSNLVLLEGWLHQVLNNKTDYEVYVVLGKDTLRLYTSDSDFKKNSQSFIRSIELTANYNVLPMSFSNDFVFSIFYKGEKSSDRLYLKAGNQDEYDIWTKQLEDLIKKSKLLKASANGETKNNGNLKTIRSSSPRLSYHIKSSPTSSPDKSIMNSETTKLKNDLNLEKETVSQLKVEKCNLENSLKDKVTDLENLKAKLKTIEGSLSTKVNSANQSEITKYSSKITNLEEQVKRLEKEKLEMKKERESVDQKLRISQIEVDKVKSDYKKLEEMKNKFETMHLNESLRKEKMQEQNDLKETCAKLKKENQDMNTKLEQKIKELELTKADVTKLTDEVKNIKQQKTKDDGTIKQLREESKKSSEGCKEKEEKINNLNKEIMNNKSQIKTINEECEKLKKLNNIQLKEIEGLKDVHKSSKTNNNSSEENNENLNKLTEEKNKLELENKKLNEKVKTVEFKSLNLQKEIEIQTIQEKSLTNEHQKLQNEIDKLEKDFDQLKSEKENLESGKISQIEQENKVLKELLIEIKSRLFEKTSKDFELLNKSIHLLSGDNKNLLRKTEQLIKDVNNKSEVKDAKLEGNEAELLKKGSKEDLERQSTEIEEIKKQNEVLLEKIETFSKTTSQLTRLSSQIDEMMGELIKQKTTTNGDSSSSKLKLENENLKNEIQIMENKTNLNERQIKTDTEEINSLKKSLNDLELRCKDSTADIKKLQTEKDDILCKYNDMKLINEKQISTMDLNDRLTDVHVNSICSTILHSSSVKYDLNETKLSMSYHQLLYLLSSFDNSQTILIQLFRTQLKQLLFHTYLPSLSISSDPSSSTSSSSLSSISQQSFYQYLNKTLELSNKSISQLISRILTVLTGQFILKLPNINDLKFDWSLDETISSIIDDSDRGNDVIFESDNTNLGACLEEMSHLLAGEYRNSKGCKLDTTSSTHQINDISNHVSLKISEEQKNNVFLAQLGLELKTQSTDSQDPEIENKSKSSSKIINYLKSKIASLQETIVYKSQEVDDLKLALSVMSEELKEEMSKKSKDNILGIEESVGILALCGTLLCDDCQKSLTSHLQTPLTGTITSLVSGLTSYWESVEEIRAVLANKSQFQSTLRDLSDRLNGSSDLLKLKLKELSDLLHTTIDTPQSNLKSTSIPNIGGSNNNSNQSISQVNSITNNLNKEEE